MLSHSGFKLVPSIIIALLNTGQMFYKLLIRKLRLTLKQKL